MLSDRFKARSDAAHKAWATRKKIMNDIVPIQVEETNTPVISKSTYFYDPDRDTYITYLKDKTPVVVSGDTHRNMCKAYSNWNGNASTVADICSLYSFPQNSFLEYKNIHGWTHDQEPFSTEEIRSKPIDHLVEDALSNKKQQFRQKFEARANEDIKKSADKWEHFSENVLRHFDSYISKVQPYNLPVLAIQEAENPFAAVIAPMDFHYGLGSWRDETGNSYSRAEAREAIFEHTEKLMNRIAMFGRPEKIIMPISSDWFHVDNPQGRTTGGTPQDLDGTPGLILVEGMELCREHIDLVRQIAPVEIIPCPGNHDRSLGTTLMMFLLAWYRNPDLNMNDVYIHKSIKSRNYTSYGNTLLAFSHGDSPKASELVRLIPSEARELWGECEHTALFTGHYHYEMSREDSGVCHYQVPSLASSDIWHYSKGYVSSRKAMAAYLIDKAAGPVGTLISPRLGQKHNGFKLKKHQR